MIMTLLTCALGIWENHRHCHHEKSALSMLFASYITHHVDRVLRTCCLTVWRARLCKSLDSWHATRPW